METPLSTELMLLGWSTVLLVVHILLQGQFATRERGLAWNAGPRDSVSKPLGTLTGRAARALSNFKETYPVFIALALGLAVTDRAGGIGELGAWAWFLARILYLPLYLAGIPYVRSIVWLISMIGLAMMLIRFV